MKKPKHRKPGKAKRRADRPAATPSALVKQPNNVQQARRVPVSATRTARSERGVVLLLLPFLILVTIYTMQPGLNAGLGALGRWLEADKPAVVAIDPAAPSLGVPAGQTTAPSARPSEASPPTTAASAHPRVETAPVIAARPVPPPAYDPDTAEPEHAAAMIARRQSPAAPPHADPGGAIIATPDDTEHASALLAARAPLAIAAPVPPIRTARPPPRDPEHAGDLLALRSPIPLPALMPVPAPTTPVPPDPEQVAALIPAGRPPLARAPEPAPSCQAGSHPFAVRTSAPASSVSADDPEFGLKLARAARDQTREMVIYNARYFSLAYPMGDVPPMFGVCTDVVVRAYRALGIDLQPLVHRSRASRGDRHIDHRRVEVLRRFFELHGESLPITDFVENYRPGDIVTYHRPQGRTSNAHIALVADAIAPSGRPMVIHNRGWGTQLEDALFADRITGHFRYRGPRSLQVQSTSSATPHRAGRARVANVE